jgi:hypothetical protein
LQGGKESHEFIVLRVVIPRRAGQPILRLELITVRRVVNNDNIFQGPASPLHILDELPSIECAVLSKKALGSDAFRIKNIHEGISILGQRGSENNYFPVLANFLYEFTAVGPHLDINIADFAFNIDW